MNALVWNCRGFGQPPIVRQLRKMVKMFKPSFVFLSETQKKRSYMETKRKSMRFAGNSYVCPIDQAGGLALWWVEGISCKILDSDQFFIDVLVEGDDGFYITFVHAPSDPNRRRDFWDRISSLRSSFDDKWVVIGDMNVILFPEEKLGGGPPRNESVIPFKNFVDDNALMDLGFKGYPFTWNNNREGQRRVEERLDRALCSASWRSKFRNALVFHELPIESDHWPLRLEMKGTKVRSNPPFRFDSRWLNQEECNNIVNCKWDNGGMCHDRLLNCEKELKEWAREVYWDQNKRAADIQARLEEIFIMDRSVDIVQEEKFDDRTCCHLER
ncbi:unnamed protein product [Linum trigynum]|uniref:Endonuclease/exonuclease/phosphatase domain-containing protein n=1 Tax=Linum trigynum TaxID=586398 RepID=A0AAV2GPS1_9ROSI